MKKSQGKVPLVTSVEVVVRDAWWCAEEIAQRVSEFVDLSPQCSLFQAIRNNHVFLVQRLLQYKPSIQLTALQQAIEAAAQRGCVNVIQWLVLHRPELAANARLMDKAAFGGHLSLLQWLDNHRVSPSPWGSSAAMDSAAANGFLDAVQWLHRHPNLSTCTARAMDNAALHGHLDVVKWLHANRTEGATTDAMDNAARHGHVNIVRFLHQFRSEGCSSRAIALAADRGHAESVRFLFENFGHQRENAASAMAYAAYRGHSRVVQYLLEQQIAQAPPSVGYEETASAVLVRERYTAEWVASIQQKAAERGGS